MTMLNTPTYSVTGDVPLYTYMRMLYYCDMADSNDIMGMLLTRTPTNDLGLPLALYRPDFLPDEPSSAPPAINIAVVDGDAPAQSLNHIPLEYYDCAKVDISYDEGFPSVNGSPLWMRFEFEPKQLYKCFELYLQQVKQGARQLGLVLNEPECPTDITIHKLEHAFKHYMWKSRVKAYDMFYEAHRSKQRQYRAIEAGDSDYFMAEKLFSLAKMYMKDNEESLLEGMSPKALLEFIKLSSQLRRLSAGLPAQGPPQEAMTHSSTSSVDVIMRTIAQSDGTLDNTVEEEKADQLEYLLGDEDSIAMAQELIIKVNAKDDKNNSLSPQQEGTTPGKPSMDTL